MSQLPAQAPWALFMFARCAGQLLSLRKKQKAGEGRDDLGCNPDDLLDAH